MVQRSPLDHGCWCSVYSTSRRCVREVWTSYDVVTHLVREGAQVLHGDQVVELSVLLEVHEKEEVGEDGEGQIEIESERGELKERRTCTWMT